MVSLEMSKQHYSILVMEMCFDMMHGKTKFDQTYQWSVKSLLKRVMFGG